MPTYRKLHVKTLESLDINDMPDDFTRLFWVLLPLALDCNGCGLDSTAWLKSKVFPLREDPIARKISEAMDWLVERGMVRRYQVGGRCYFWLPTFAHYQGDTSKEAASPYPPPPSEVLTYSGPTPELVESKSASDAYADAYTETNAEATTDLAADAALPSSPPELVLVEPPPEPPNRKRQAKPKEPLHPAIAAFHAGTGRYPAKAMYSDIETTVGGDPANCTRFQEVCHAYVGCGWNPGNVRGMLNFYKDGKMPGEDLGKARASPKRGGNGPRFAQPDYDAMTAAQRIARLDGWGLCPTCFCSPCQCEDERMVASEN